MPTVTPLDNLLRRADRADRVLHVEQLPAREGETTSWPAWVDPELLAAFAARGITAPWLHQTETAEAAQRGEHVVVATGTASGKSLGYLMPMLTSILDGQRAPNGRGATAIYLAPTKALAHDQLAAIEELDIQIRAAAYDGDTPREERKWVRTHANLIVTNPDLLHYSMLPSHEAWASFLRALRFVVVDESHIYRGIFGSHVALVLRRLRRIARRYGSDPIFICASATSADPSDAASRLIGADVVAITRDTSPRGPVTFALWEPPLTDASGEHDAPVRRGVAAESADLLADLVCSQTRSLAFVRSRRGAEAVAMMTRDLVREVDPSLAQRVAAYRGGFLPEERRALESDLRDGRLLAAATTSALELGIDISGLDAILIAGWPGTRAALWQQAGRAGREGQPALAILIGRDDPLDAYVLHHPETIFGSPVESTVIDPFNPNFLKPHLACAAAELPLTDAEVDAQEWFGANARVCAEELAAQGILRRRPASWYWTDPSRPTEHVDIRGAGATVRLVEFDTGRLLGTIDASSAHSQAHRGAVYVHQGETYVVRQLDLVEGVALVEEAQVDYSTQARDVSDVHILTTEETIAWGPVAVSRGTVEVTAQVVSFMRRRYLTGEVLGEEAVELPIRTLETRAVWWTIPDDVLLRAALVEGDVPGAAHAAEHAAIGLLPLIAMCDRWDIGGVSTALHPDTGMCTIVVYDGHPGGAGFADRGFERAHEWLAATLTAISGCKCTAGCPACVQSPKCGNGNNPLDKDGATRLLSAMLTASAVS